MCICADAVRRLYPGATDSEVRKVVTTWLTGSRDRDNGKMESEEAKKTRQAAAGTGTTGRGRVRKQNGLDRQKIGSKSLFSPEIPDRRETSDIPGLPFGGGGGGGGESNPLLSGISELSFDSPFLYPLLFFSA